MLFIGNRQVYLSGASIASVTTDARSISDLNIKKMGFQIAYTRIKYDMMPLI